MTNALEIAIQALFVKALTRYALMEIQSIRISLLRKGMMSPSVEVATPVALVIPPPQDFPGALSVMERPQLVPASMMNAREVVPQALFVRTPTAVVVRMSVKGWSKSVFLLKPLRGQRVLSVAAAILVVLGIAAPRASRGDISATGWGLPVRASMTNVREVAIRRLSVKALNPIVLMRTPSTPISRRQRVAVSV